MVSIVERGTHGLKTFMPLLAHLFNRSDCAHPFLH